MIVVTEVTGHGSIRRGVLDTAACSDADRFKDLIEQAALDLPPPYQPVTARPVYQIRANDTIAWVAERELVGPLRELVMTTFSEGDHTSPSMAWQPPAARTEADQRAPLPAASGRVAPG